MITNDVKIGHWIACVDKYSFEFRMWDTDVFKGCGENWKSGHAGRGWYEGFMACQAILTLCTPQPLSYASAVCVN